MTLKELEEKINYTVENCETLSAFPIEPGVTVKVCGAYRNNSLNWFALQYSIGGVKGLLGEPDTEDRLVLHFSEVDDAGNRAETTYFLAGATTREQAEQAAKIIIERTKDWGDYKLFWMGD